MGAIPYIFSAGIIAVDMVIIRCSCAIRLTIQGDHLDIDIVEGEDDILHILDGTELDPLLDQINESFNISDLEKSMEGVQHHKTKVSEDEESDLVKRFDKSYDISDSNDNIIASNDDFNAPTSSHQSDQNAIDKERENHQNTVDGGC